MRRTVVNFVTSLPLLSLLIVMVFAAGCGDDNPADPVPGGQFSSIELSVHQQVNAYRASKGLAALEMVPVMVTQARNHSANMAVGRTPFGHDGFEDRVEEIAKTVALAGAGENVAFNTGFDDPATEAVQGWLNSQGHRENIEGDFNVTGIGVERNADGTYYFTQIFGRR